MIIWLKQVIIQQGIRVLAKPLFLLTIVVLGILIGLFKTNTLPQPAPYIGSNSADSVSGVPIYLESKQFYRSRHGSLHLIEFQTNDPAELVIDTLKQSLEKKGFSNVQATTDTLNQKWLIGYNDQLTVIIEATSNIIIYSIRLKAPIGAY